MFNSFSDKNKIDAYVYLSFSFLLVLVFSMLAYVSYASFLKYKNSVTEPFYNFKSDAVKLSSSPVTDQLVFIIIDGLSYADSARLASLNEFKKKSIHSKIKIYEPTLSLTSWMTFLTGAPPDIHGFISPACEAKYTACENLFSIAKSRTLKTALFGHKDWKPLVGEFIDIGFYKNFNPLNTNIIDIDAEIMSNAISYIKNERPNFTLIHLPGLDRTSHIFGKKSHEYKVHIEKLDGVLSAFLNSSLVNERYVVVASDHGHVEKGGHGGGEAEVTGALFMMAGPGVITERIGFLKIDQRDVCPTISSLLGIPPPYLNSGSFLSRAFKFSDYLKNLKMRAVINQKTNFYRSYLNRISAAGDPVFDSALNLEDIEAKSSSLPYKEKQLMFESYEKKSDFEFEKKISDYRHYGVIYRFIYLGVIVFIFLAFLMYKFRNGYRLFSALAQIAIFYSIYYGIYFFHGFNFSISDVNSFDLFGQFMDKRRIEVICALLLSFTPLLMNYFVLQKRFYIWLNYVFFPVFFEFNSYLAFTICAQCLYFIGLFGARIDFFLPDMRLAFKYYLDIQMLIVVELAMIAIFILAYWALMHSGGKNFSSKRAEE